MGIKSFHLAFILVSFLLFLYVVWYAVTEMSGGMRYVLGGGSAILAVGVVVYGRRFLQKMKALEATN